MIHSRFLPTVWGIVAGFSLLMLPALSAGAQPQLQESAEAPAGDGLRLETPDSGSSSGEPADASIEEATDRPTEEPSDETVEDGVDAAAPGAPATEDIDPGTVFVQANTAYEEGAYPQAIRLYRQLLAAGVENGHLHYNLGNAYLRNGELGRAIASYRRAEAFRPRDQDVQANLSFARKSTKDALSPPDPSEVFSTLFFWHYGLSRAELATVVLLLNLLFWGGLALRLRYRGSEILRWANGGLLILLLLTGGSLLAHIAFPQQVAVIVPQEVSAHTGPDAETVVRFKLHAGTEVRIADARKEWLRVQLPDGQQGWVAREQAEVVRF
ncbi:MAG: tetratricopeptide repeat protein [Acidobacteriota bacterium]|nr:tetratricopeptide repeat protein [Acidobacteriota bacterium]